MTLALALPHQPALRPIRPPRKGRAIPCRGEQSASGARGTADATAEARFQPGNTAALNSGARWILDHAADAPLPARIESETKDRILEMRSALAEAWTATPHASTPLGGLGLAAITRLATAMICLDEDAASRSWGESEQKRTAAAKQMPVLLSRLGREMSRWGLIWGPWAQQASPAPSIPPGVPPESVPARDAPASSPAPEPPAPIITKPDEVRLPKGCEELAGRILAATLPPLTVGSEKQKTGRSPVITVIRRAHRGRSSAGRAPLVSVSRFPMKVNARGAIVSPSLPGMEAWSSDLPHSAVAVPAGGLTRPELLDVGRQLGIPLMRRRLGRLNPFFT
jgi:hypothetical protein